MITKLTESQLNLMKEVQNYWISRVTSNEEMDDGALHNSIEWLYSLISLPKPQIFVVDSPVAAQIFANLYQKVVSEQVMQQVEQQVREQVWQQVGQQVGQQVKNNFSFFNFSYYGSVSDFGWASFCDFFNRIGLIKCSEFDKFMDIFHLNIYEMIQLKGICIVSKRPTSILKDDQNRMHSTSGPAIEFADGYKLYFIHGRAVPEDIFIKCTSGSVTKEDFLSEKNAEIKGAIYEILGQQKMMKLLGAVEVDTRQIIHANGDLETVTLLKTEESFPEIDNLPFAWVKVVCPSTGTQYLLGVEPHHTNALEALSSLSHFKAAEYSFDFRS